ncbi:spermidine/spermine N1-acetyl transferase 1 variant 4, partial [gut metagenome]
MSLDIRPVRREDCETVCHLIHELARYEHLEEQCVANADMLMEAFFGDRGFARCFIAWEKNDRTGDEKSGRLCVV